MSRWLRLGHMEDSELKVFLLSALSYKWYRIAHSEAEVQFIRAFRLLNQIVSDKRDIC